MAIRFIDLFAGIGGIRKGFETAFNKAGFKTECVLTSEIKPHAIQTLQTNYPNENVNGDITQIKTSDIPDFDFLLAGFPCQAFSSAGRRLGFMDARGTLFFDIARILKEKKPYGFILENVEGLVTHDRENTSQKMGKTLTTILSILDELGYKVTWKVLNSKDFGVPQERKRVYIVGTTDKKITLDNLRTSKKKIKDILEQGLPIVTNRLSTLLLNHYKPTELYGKSIKDKRGGASNIHSWDIELKGSVSEDQRKLLNILFKERRKKIWADVIGITWMDGMPLTEKQISTFFIHKDLKKMLDDLVRKGYLKYEHPKELIIEETSEGKKQYRKPQINLPKGYNIVSGKLSFEINKILDPNSIAPTLVAMDMKKIFVVDGNGLRTLSPREGLRMFGYPENFQLPVPIDAAYDLLGNTVVVPVISSISELLADTYKIYQREMTKSIPVYSL